jgi:hypothetical protein
MIRTFTPPITEMKDPSGRWLRTGGLARARRWTATSPTDDQYGKQALAWLAQLQALLAPHRDLGPMRRSLGRALGEEGGGISRPAIQSKCHFYTIVNPITAIGHFFGVADVHRRVTGE